MKFVRVINTTYSFRLSAKVAKELRRGAFDEIDWIGEVLRRMVEAKTLTG